MVLLWLDQYHHCFVEYNPHTSLSTGTFTVAVCLCGPIPWSKRDPKLGTTPSSAKLGSVGANEILSPARKRVKPRMLNLLRSQSTQAHASTQPQRERTTLERGHLLLPLVLVRSSILLVNPWKTCRRGGESGFADGNDKHGAHRESAGQSVAALVGGSPRPSSPFTTVHTDRGEERGRQCGKGGERDMQHHERPTARHPRESGGRKVSTLPTRESASADYRPPALMALAAASVGST